MNFLLLFGKRSNRSNVGAFDGMGALSSRVARGNVGSFGCMGSGDLPIGSNGISLRVSKGIQVGPKIVQCCGCRELGK